MDEDEAQNELHSALTKARKLNQKKSKPTIEQVNSLILSLKISSCISIATVNKVKRYIRIILPVCLHA